MYSRIKRFLIGEPLTSQHMAHEKLPKWKALAVLSSDALSSVAYATEEILLPLSAFAFSAITWSLPVALVISTLIVFVTISYQQTIESYPNGGGAYIVAKDNLGVSAGLLAAASLLTDYVLTVAVSASAGVAALTSAFPFLMPHTIALCVFSIILLMIFNLRGVRESGTIFAFPTYFFIFSFITMIVAGIWNMATGHHVAQHPLVHEVYPAIPLMLFLRAFSSGCSALTGIEAISNAVPAFRPPVQRNAKSTMLWMSAILATFFLSITSLAHLYGVVPREGETVVSVLARDIFGGSFFYYVIQFATALILFLAANTSYADFPRLSSLLAKDRFLPRQLASLGDKLVFSNGILGLSGAAIFLVFMFQGDTHHLIPLYAVGVFLSFTLSQAGMVVHHLREKKPGYRRSMLINGTGAGTTFIVFSVILFTKFVHGAWMVAIFIPFLMLVFWKIHTHYLKVGKELSLVGLAAPPSLQPLKHTVIIPISGIHRGVIDALRYAVSISNDVRACYVELDPESTERVRAEWDRWAHEVPFVVLKSPYRSVITPLIEYINDVEQITHNEMITVIIPEFVTAKFWHTVLHNQTAFLIRTALLFKRNKIVTSVRYHLKST